MSTVDITLGQMESNQHSDDNEGCELIYFRTRPSSPIYVILISILVHHLGHFVLPAPQLAYRYGF